MADGEAFFVKSFCILVHFLAYTTYEKSRNTSKWGIGLRLWFGLGDVD